MKKIDGFEWQKKLSPGALHLTDRQIILILRNEKRIAKGVIDIFRAEAIKRNITKGTTLEEDEENLRKANVPLPLLYMLTAILLEPLLIWMFKSIAIPIRGSIAAYAEGNGYKRRARQSWTFLGCGFVLYLAILVLTAYSHDRVE